MVKFMSADIFDSLAGEYTLGDLWNTSSGIDPVVSKFLFTNVVQIWEIGYAGKAFQ